MKQICVEGGYGSEADALAAIDDHIERLEAALRWRRLRAVEAPARPSVEVGHSETRGAYRILIQYIPPWLPSQYADQFALRVDTLAEDA